MNPQNPNTIQSNNFQQQQYQQNYINRGLSSSAQPPLNNNQPQLLINNQPVGVGGKYQPQQNIINDGRLKPVQINSLTSIPPPPNMNRNETGYQQTDLYRDQKNIDPNNQNFSKFSNNQVEIPSNYNDPNNLNHSFNPSGQNLHNQQYPLQSSNQYFSQQQINSDKQIDRQISSQSINIPSLQNIPQSSQSIAFQQPQQLPSSHNIGASHNLPPGSIDQLDQNMLKSNPINNIYQKTGGPFRPPSGANQALNTIAHPSQAQISGLQTVGVIYRNPSIQSDQVSQSAFVGNTNIQKVAAIKDDISESIREEDIFGEDITESEESFWDYQSPDDWQHLIPVQQQGVQGNTQTAPSRNKSKLGGIMNSQIQNQTQIKQNKKGQSAAKSTGNQLKEKDPFFGIDPLKLVVKDFPQGEDEESVFQWWDQIDDVYFPSSIKKGFFHMFDIEAPNNIEQIIQNLEDIEIEDNGTMKRKLPIKLSQNQNSSASENSSIYYLMAKDNYKQEPLPYKQPNYLSVLYYSQFNNNPLNNEQNDQSLILSKRSQQNIAFLAIYKLKQYDKKRQLTCDDKNTFDQIASQLQIIPINDKEKIEEIYQKSDYLLQINNSLDRSDQPKTKKTSKQQIHREKQDLSGYEPNLTKQFFGNNQIIPISQLQQNNLAENLSKNGFNYDKNKYTIKLKKIIQLDKSSIFSALQSSHFLNKFLSKKQKSLQNQTSIQDENDSDSETIREFLKIQKNDNTPIEQNIFSLEYELAHLQVSQRLNELKQTVFERSKKEGNYLELRNLSVQINDNLKWLTIRKNLIHGFSDRLAYDSENYFNYEAEEKTGINLSRSEIIQEKEIFEKMSSSEQEKMSQQRIQTAANELQLKQQQQQERMQRNKEKKQKQEDDEQESEQQVAGKSIAKPKVKIQKRKQNDENEEEDEEEFNDEDDDGDEDSNQAYNNKKDSLKKQDKIGGIRTGSRIKRIMEDEENQGNNSNENSIDGTDNINESDRGESPAINRIKNQEEQQEHDIKKSEQKNRISSSINNKKKKKQKQKNKNKFLETDCSVCFHHVNNENNTVVYCSQCNGSFHKHCYGIDFIPEEKFLCKKCEYKNQQMIKKKSNTNCQKQPLRDEISKQFHCKLCTETLLPVISIYDDSYFYHPSCLFIFNYAIYKDQALQLRHNVTHQSIAEDIKKQNTIACEFCLSKKGLKVKCCHFGKPRQSYQQFFNNPPKKYAMFSKKVEANLQSNPQLIIEKKEEGKDEQIQLNQQQIEQKIEQEEEQLNINDNQFQETKKEEDVKIEFSKEGEVNKESNLEKIEIESIKQEEDSDFYLVSEEDNEEEDCEEFGCNYYIHPLCAFLNGFEIWLDSSDEDKEYEKIIIESDFQNLQHLGLKILFKCKEHSDKINRNYDEQIYYRRYQINYRNICQYTTFQEYQQTITKQRTSEEEQWNEINSLEKEYMENYQFFTKIKLNRKEIEASYLQQELFYSQNPHLKEQLHQLEIEELEEEAASQKEQDMLLFNQQHLQQQSLLNIEEDDEDGNTQNITQQMDEVNTFDETENRTNMDDDQDEDEENSQQKRRSKRHSQRKIIQLQQLSGNKNQDNFDEDQYGLENESQDDYKKEGSRTRQQNQKRSSSKVQASYSSLSEGRQDINKSRRSRRLVHNNNSKGKSQYSNFQNADDDDDNQESSYNQGLSSFENTLNKVNLKENNLSNQIEKQQSPNQQNQQQQSSLPTLAQFCSKTDKKEDTQIEQEEEFQGIQRKNQKQLNKEKPQKRQINKYIDDADVEQDECELELDEDYFDYDILQDQFQDEDYDEEEEDGDDLKYTQRRGIGKQGRMKRVGARRSKSNQHDISSSSLDNNQGRSTSRGNSPPNKSNITSNSSSNKQEIQKVLNNARNLAKNGKIGKGTSIFANQNKRKKSIKNEGSKSSLMSIENQDVEDFEGDDDNALQQEKEQTNEIDPIGHEEDQLTRTLEQTLLFQNQQQEKQKLNDSKTQKSLILDQNTEEVEEENNQNSNKNKILTEGIEEDEIINDHNQDQIGTKSTKQQRISKSPQPKNTQEQVHKQDLEGDNLKLHTQNSDNQQQSTQTKYNLRKHQSKNYKSSLIREDSDFINPHILNNPQFIQQQRQAFKNHGFTNEQNQFEEEVPLQTQNSGATSGQNKKRQIPQAAIPHNIKGESIENLPIPKLKNKKNSKQSQSSQSNIGQSKKGLENEQLQNEESSSQQGGNQQNEIDFGNQFSLNSHQSQEEPISNEQVITKGKVQRKRQAVNRSDPHHLKQGKKGSTRSKQLIQENDQTHKLAGDNSVEEENLQIHQNEHLQQQQGRVTDYKIYNPKESQELLDFDQFEQQDQILNPNNLKFS